MQKTAFKIRRPVPLQHGCSVHRPADTLPWQRTPSRLPGGRMSADAALARKGVLPLCSSGGGHGNGAEPARRLSERQRVPPGRRRPGPIRRHLRQQAGTGGVLFFASFLLDEQKKGRRVQGAAPAVRGEMLGACAEPLTKRQPTRPWREKGCDKLTDSGRAKNVEWLRDDPFPCAGPETDRSAAEDSTSSQPWFQGSGQGARPCWE